MTERTGGAVLGTPIAHSLSPVLHRAAYHVLGLTDWSYRAIECDENELAERLRGLDAAAVAGVSLTMPLKRAVLPLLAEVDGWAQQVGAANTVLFGAAFGRWHGANTDVPGMIAVLRSAGVSSADPGSDRAPWVLGAGATAGSALAALAALGQPRAVVVARRPEATGDLQAVAERVGVDIDVRPWGEVTGLAGTNVVISTTPAGATDALAGGLTTAEGLLFDVVYSPWPTPLAAAWMRTGGRVLGGMELLVEQAIEQVRLMTGRTPPAEPMRQAGYAALGSP
jgi:shikimate dehydrogenase